MIEFSRIVAFSDGVFAIAITLLVLQLQIPAHIQSSEVLHALGKQHGDLVAYAISFAVIGRLWLVHHRFFSEVTHFDSRLMTLNLAYLAFIVLIPFPSEVLGDHGDTTGGVVIYATDLLVVNLIGAAMFLYAGWAGLSDQAFARHLDRPTRMRSLTGAAAFAISIPVALLNPTVAVLIWIAVFFLPGTEAGDEPLPEGAEAGGD